MHHHEHDFEDEEVLQVAQHAPEFDDIDSYQKGEYHKISLKDYHGKWLVLFFYF